MASKNMEQAVKSGYFNLDPAFKPEKIPLWLPINPETSG
jgi:hypothetical protein